MRNLLFCVVLLGAFLGLYPNPMYSQSSRGSQGTGTAEEIEGLENFEVSGTFPGWNSGSYHRVDRVVNVMTAHTIEKRSFLFTIDHRTWQALEEDSFQDFLGFDAGNLKIGLGLRYGLLDNLEVGVLRSNGTFPRHRSDTYDFDSKYKVLEQEEHYLDVAVRGGITWLSTKEDEDSAGFFFQLLSNRAINERLRLGTGFLYHSDSYNDDKSRTDPDYSAAIPILLEVRLTGRLMFGGEIVPNIAGYAEDHPTFAMSLKFLTHRHSFALVFSNNRHFTPDGIATNTNRDFEDMIMGFTITRELHL